MSTIEIKVPDIGDFKDVTIIEVLVKPGDAVQLEQSLITVESDKASMEIPSSHAGVLQELKVKLGDKVNEGDVIAVLQADAAASAAPAKAPETPAQPASAPTPAASASAQVPAAAAYAGSSDNYQDRKSVV